MKATAKIDDLRTPHCKNTIIRNLSRIMDIRILDIDLERHSLSFVYDSIAAFEKAKKELQRIGYPILQCKYETPDQRRKTLQHDGQLLGF